MIIWKIKEYEKPIKIRKKIDLMANKPNCLFYISITYFHFALKSICRYLNRQRKTLYLIVFLKICVSHLIVAYRCLTFMSFDIYFLTLTLSILTTKFGLLITFLFDISLIFICLEGNDIVLYLKCMLSNINSYGSQL